MNEEQTIKTLRAEDVEVEKPEVAKPGALMLDYDPSDPAHYGYDTDPSDCCAH